MATVLITGTSKGIGYDAALVLARAGHEVIATMRNPGVCDLEKVATEAKLPVRVLRLDVDDDESVAEVFGEVGASIRKLRHIVGIALLARDNEPEPRRVASRCVLSACSVGCGAPELSTVLLLQGQEALLRARFSLK